MTIGVIAASYVDDSYSSYEEAILDMDPLGYWKMNEASGLTAFDSSGFGRDGVYSGSPVLGSSNVFPAIPSDTSVNFSTFGKVMDVPVVSEFSAQAFTILVWHTPTGGSGQCQWLRMGTTVHAFSQDAKSTVSIQFNDGAIALATWPLWTGGPCFTAVTVDAATGRVISYKNGVVEYDHTRAPFTINTPTGFLRVGGVFNTNAPQVQLGHLSIHAGALSAAQILALTELGGV